MAFIFHDEFNEMPNSWTVYCQYCGCPLSVQGADGFMMKCPCGSFVFGSAPPPNLTGWTRAVSPEDLVQMPMPNALEQFLPEGCSVLDRPPVEPKMTASFVFHTPKPVDFKLSSLDRKLLRVWGITPWDDEPA